jgi:hypothetical protein
MTSEMEPDDRWATSSPPATDQHCAATLSDFAREERNRKLTYIDITCTNVYGFQCCECYHVSMTNPCPNQGCSNRHDKETCRHSELYVDVPWVEGVCS